MQHLPNSPLMARQMTTPQRSIRFMGVAIALMLLGQQQMTASRAASPATQPDWLARFLSQAPGEYARLENTVGRWEIRYLVTTTYYPFDGSRRVDRRLVNGVRTVFDDGLGGIRCETSAIAPTTQPNAVVSALNPQYTFDVDKQQDGAYVITQYDEKPAAESTQIRWLEQLENYRGLAAEDFNGVSLLRSVQSGTLKISSVSTVNVNGDTCVRFECDRVFTSKRHPGTYPGWIVVDPSFHWAVRSYEQRVPGDVVRRVSIEYNPAISAVAFPREIVQEDFGLKGQPWQQKTMEFSDPKPSHAAAADFTLESLGLERPLNKAERRSRNVVMMVLINGGCLVALIVWFVLYRRSKQRTSAAVPPVATG